MPCSKCSQHRYTARSHPQRCWQLPQISWLPSLYSSVSFTFITSGQPMLFTRENLIAVLLCLLLAALVIISADTAPQWIYQGF
ncbi:hypothetical protein EMGBS1_02130 [Chloroflexota bacterium]|nr:hypothetical protein EMGBS1_02130 [Chloroflexota bacterium]